MDGTVLVVLLGDIFPVDLRTKQSSNLMCASLVCVTLGGLTNSYHATRALALRDTREAGSVKRGT